MRGTGTLPGSTWRFLAGIIYGMARLTGDMQRLAAYVADRRGELGLTQEEVKERGGPSPATQRLIETGARDSLQVGVAGGLETALQWAAGSVRAILAGREPSELVSREGEPAGSAQRAAKDRNFKERFERIAADQRERRALEAAMRAIEEQRDIG